MQNKMLNEGTADKYAHLNAPITDKVIVQLFADILYVKGILCYDEIDHLLDMSTVGDVENFTDKMFGGVFSAYKRGEAYTDRSVPRE